MLKFVTINPQDAFKIMEEKGSEITILDIRPKNEYEEEHVPGAVNLDYNGHEFKKKVEIMDKNVDYIIYCESGVRGGYFMGKMEESGFKSAYNILGGFVGWKISELPTVSDNKTK
jgi:rhodanese-related sulfurtransferase